jgi:hypothetical protein
VRKDRLARHVQVKHVKALAKLFLERCKDLNFNTIRNVHVLMPSQYNPVWSNKWETSCYFFGNKPRFFGEHDSSADHMSNHEHMASHFEFLQKVIKTITLPEFLNAFDDVFDLITLKRNVAVLQDSFKSMMALKESTIQYLEEELKKKA